MIIGDDWFMKTILLNALSRNEKVQSQTGTPNSETGNLFATVLNQLLQQQDLQSTQQPAINSMVPDMVTAMNPFISNQNTPLNSEEPLGFHAINPEKINQELDGKLKGMGQAFVNAGQKFNVDPALLAAIAKHETGNGKSPAAIEKNNIAGMMGTNGLKSYATVEESIMDMTRNLSKNYLGSGLSSISKIGAKYAPIGAGNDPSGLNNHWVNGVTHYFDQLKV